MTTPTTPAPEGEPVEPEMDEICARCYQTYGQHIGFQCPDYHGTFTTEPPAQSLSQGTTGDQFEGHPIIQKALADFEAELPTPETDAQKRINVAKLLGYEFSGPDRAHCNAWMDMQGVPPYSELLERRLAALQRENDRLTACLEPGKASAINMGMFREAERLGFYRPTAKHALTQFVEEVERLRRENEVLREERDRLAEERVELEEHLFPNQTGLPNQTPEHGAGRQN